MCHSAQCFTKAVCSSNLYVTHRDVQGSQEKDAFLEETRKEAVCCKYEEFRLWQQTSLFYHLTWGVLFNLLMPQFLHL